MLRLASILVVVVAGYATGTARAAAKPQTTESVSLIGQRMPSERTVPPVPCTNFDTPERCARRAAQEARARDRATAAPASARPAGDAVAGHGNAEAVPIEKVIVEADPEDRLAPALSAQQKLEKAWGETTIPDGPMSYRLNNGQRIECEGRVVRNRQRMGLLSYLLPIAPCVASIDPRPGYLKPGY